MKSYQIAVLEGDGIGPEVIREGVKVLRAATEVGGVQLGLEYYPYGADHYLKTGEVLPDPAIRAFQDHDAIYFGAAGDPQVPPGVLEVGLILKIREVGSMMGRLDTTPVKPELTELPPTLVHEVSCGSPVISGGGDLTVAVMDYGVKENIIRSMERRGCRVIRFPHDTPADTVLGSGADGVLLSNGPGDPSVLEREAAEAAKLLGKLPLLGVCLGNQLLAMACGGKTKKLSFGHRGANQPVLDLATGRGLLTSQNHQYAVDAASLAGTELEVAYKHLGDGTVEGLRHRRYDALSVQFHPEASPGPEDASYIFDNFIDRMKAARQGRN